MSRHSTSTEFDQEMSAKYGHLLQRITQPEEPKEFRMVAFCSGQVGPVPKLGGETFLCELEPGHQMPHIASDGTWFEDGTK